MASLLKIVSWGRSPTFAGFKYLKNGFNGVLEFEKCGNRPNSGQGTGILTDGFSGTFNMCGALTSIPGATYFVIQTAVTTNAFNSVFRATAIS